MVAKLKSSFLKNSFQLFCHKNLFQNNNNNNATTTNNKPTTKSNKRSVSSNNAKPTLPTSELNEKKKTLRSSSASTTNTQRSDQNIKKSESFQSTEMDQITLRNKRSNTSILNNEYPAANRYSYPSDQIAESNDYYDNAQILLATKTKADLVINSASSSPSSNSSSSIIQTNLVKNGLYNTKNSKSIAELKLAKKLQLMKQAESLQQHQLQQQAQKQLIITPGILVKTNSSYLNQIKKNGDFLTRLNDQLFMKNSHSNNNIQRFYTSTNAKKVVRFADSLGLELENIIQLNPTTDHSKRKFRINPASNYYYESEQKIVQNVNNSLNQFESSNNGEKCLYDEIINKLQFVGDNRSRYSTHYQTMQQQPQQLNDNLKWSNSTANLVNSTQSSNITTITTRLNNGKLESEV